MPIPLSPGVAPQIGWMLTPEEMAEGNDTCLINCPNPIRLCIDTGIFIDFPAGIQTWSIGCPGWEWMVKFGATAQAGSGVFQNPPNWTQGPVLQRILRTADLGGVPRPIFGPPLYWGFGGVIASPIPNPWG